MTAERKIVLTVIAEDPFIIWKSATTSVEELKKVIIDRKPGEDVFIQDYDRDLKITIVQGSYELITEMLNNGWKLDPFFHQTGRPWTINNGHVWVLVKGTPEEVAELNPFVELPQPEITEDDQRTIDKFEGIVDVLDLKPGELEDGRVAELCKQGFEVFNILKGSVVLVKREDKSLSFVASEDAVGPLEVRNGVLMNCNVCGHLFMVPHDVNADEFICPLCPPPIPCPDCNGSGVIEEKADPPYEEEGPVIQTCETCKGSGIVPPEEGVNT